MQDNEEKGGRRRLLFICTHNSARSQMAEGIVNRFLADGYEAKSAGTRPGGLNPFAIAVMKEIGVDISRQVSKHLSALEGEEFDVVVTVCSEAEEVCPFFPGKEHIHQGFKDPAASTGTEGEVLQAFRSSRDEIRRWIMTTFKEG